MSARWASRVGWWEPPLAARRNGQYGRVRSLDQSNDRGRCRRVDRHQGWFLDGCASAQAGRDLVPAGERPVTTRDPIIPVAPITVSFMLHSFERGR